MNLETWIKFVKEDQIPALSSTVQQIARLTEKDDSPLSALKDLILQDAALTANVLRLTNSAYHIPRTKKMNTISRALVMLGFNEVRNLCLTMAVFDGLKRGNPRPRLIDEMARAFHAALQARYMAVQRGERSCEEVFTATLLYRLGNMAFWCFAGEEADALAEELDRGVPEEEAQMNVLGFKLSELTLGLCTGWGLGELLESSLKMKEDNRCKSIRMSHRLVEAVETGWDSAEALSVINELSSFVGIPAAALVSALRENAKEAVQTASIFGSSAAAEQLQETAETENAPRAAKEEKEPEPELPPPDPMLQLRILRELSNLVEMQAEVSFVLELILEGIYRGIGMDRALFALFNQDRTSITIKSAIGANRQRFLQQFRFDLQPGRPNIFSYVLEQEKPVWIADTSNRDIRDLISRPMAQLVGSDPFFLAPTIVNGQPIGIFFANRIASKRPLDQEAFEAFKQFTVQARLTLEHIGRQQ